MWDVKSSLQLVETIARGRKAPTVAPGKQAKQRPHSYSEAAWLEYGRYRSS